MRAALLMHLVCVTLSASPVPAQCRVDDVGGGLALQPGVLAIDEIDEGGGLLPWVGGWIGTTADYGVRRLRGASWQAVGSPFTFGATLVSFDDGSGPRIFAAPVMGTSGVWRWDGMRWVVAGALPAASVLFATDLGTGPVLLAGSDGVDQWNGTSWLRLHTLPRVISGPGSFPGRAAAMAVLATGAGRELWVGGTFGTNQDVNLVRRTPAGVWSSSGIAANASINALHVHNDGTGPVLFAAGSFTTIGSVTAPGLAQWTGAAWSPIGAGAPGSAVWAMTTHDDGSGARLYAGLQDGRVVRLDPSGWTTVGTASGGIATLRSLRARRGLAVGGSFATVDGVPTLGVAEWNGASWSQLGAPLAGDCPAQVLSLEAVHTPTGSAVFAGGEFQVAGRSIAAANIARFDGTGWSRLGGGLRRRPGVLQQAQRVTAIAWHADATGAALFAGGFMLELADDVVPISNIARWDGSRWSSPGGGLPGAIVAALESHGGYLFAACNPPGPYGPVARWDGVQWQSAHAGLPAQISDLRVVALGTGPMLLAGTGSGLFHWTGTTWSPLGPAVGIRAATAFDDGTGPALFAGQTASVVKLVGSSWQTVGSFAGTALEIRALEAIDDGTGPQLWVAGRFDSVNGVPAACLARWNGSVWSTPSPAGLANALRRACSQLAGAVALATLGTGVFVGGQFGGAGGSPVDGIARWDCGVAPSLSWTQPGGSGGPLFVTNTNLVAGREYYNLLSLEPCPGGPGTGPILGLCATTPAAVQFLVDQALLPIGVPLLHFAAPAGHVDWGAYWLGAITLDAVTLDVTGGLLGGTSGVRRIVVR